MFDFGFSASVSAATVSVARRVSLSAGNGVRNVRVHLTVADGTVHVATSSAFAYYRFDEIPSGQSVVMGIASKRFTFTPSTRFITLGDDATSVDWVANE